MSLKAANLVLQTTPGTLECIVDRKINVGVTLIGIRLVPNIDLLFIRQSDADMDLEKTAGPVVLPWTFQHHATACNPAVIVSRAPQRAAQWLRAAPLAVPCLETRYALGFPSWLLDYRRAKESVLASN